MSKDAAPAPAPDAAAGIDWRLYVMMFLQYAVWGVWLPILPNYLKGTVAEGGLGFDGYQVGWILATAAATGAAAGSAAVASAGGGAATSATAGGAGMSATTGTASASATVASAP